MGWSAAQPPLAKLQLTTQQLAIAGSAEAGAHPAGDAVIEHGGFQLFVAAGRLLCRRQAEEQNRCRYGDQQGTALVLVVAGPDPAGIEAMQIHLQGAAGPRAEGMATGLSPHLGVMAGAGAAHPTHGASYKHWRAGAKPMQARHGEADAASTAAAEEATAEGAQHRPPGGWGEAFAAAHCHHTVFADAAMQQQPPGSNLLEREPGFQFLAGLLRCGQPAGAEGQRVAPKQLLKGLRAAVLDRQHQIGVAVPTTAFSRTQSTALDAHGRVGRPQMQHQRGLGREASLAGYHHMGLGEGVLQAQGCHALLKGRGAAHLQIAATLQLLQVLLRAAGALRCGRQGRNNR